MARPVEFDSIVNGCKTIMMHENVPLLFGHPVEGNSMKSTRQKGAESEIGSGRNCSNKNSFNARQLPRKKQRISVPTIGENTNRKYSGTLTWMLVKTVLMRLTSEISDASATSFIVQHRSCSCNTIKAGSTKCATGGGRKQSYQRPRFAYHATSMVLH